MGHVLEEREEIFGSLGERFLVPNIRSNFKLSERPLLLNGRMAFFHWTCEIVGVKMKLFW